MIASSTTTPFLQRFFSAGLLVRPIVPLLLVVFFLGSCEEDKPNYKVIFESQGKQFAVKTVKQGDKVIRPKDDPTRDGYVFKGWYKEPTFTTLFDFSNDRITKNLTLYAKWENATYTVTFVIDVAGVSPPDPLVDVPSFSMIADPKYELSPGLTLDGWYRESTFTTRFDFDHDIIEGDLTLYGKVIEGIIVTFMSNGQIAGKRTVKDGNNVTPPELTREGYVFEGWYKEPTFDTRFNVDQEPITEPLTLYAKWENAKYTVTFTIDVEGVTPPDPLVDVPSFSMITAPQEPVLSGYTFDAWYRESVFTTRFDFDRDTIKSDLTLYGRLVQGGIKVTFDVDSGSAVHPAVIAPSSTVSRPADPVKQNFAFIGWYTTVNKVVDERFGFDMTTVDQDMTLYAKWDAASNYRMTGEVLNYVQNPNNNEVVELPSSINGNPITALQSDVASASILVTAADATDANVKWAIVPYSVTRIGNSAFARTTLLDSITLSKSVTSIEDYAFSKCGTMATVVLPEELTHIGEGAFSGCSKLRSITIPGGVMNIGKRAFADCVSLVTLIVEDGVERIGERAFSKCDSLGFIKIGVVSGAVELPTSLTAIDEAAFYECTSLIQLTIPEGVTTIADSAFYKGLSLGYIKNSNNPNSNDDDINGFLMLPTTLSVIGKAAFFGCTTLQEVTLPANLQTLDEGAFSGCISLRGIEIPGGVGSISKRAFAGCISMVKLTIKDGVTSIGERAFSDCPGLGQVDRNHKGEVNLPTSLRVIDKEAFYNCQGGFMSLTIPEGVTTIGDRAFYKCASLGFFDSSKDIPEDRGLTLPTTLRTIGEEAFAYCSALRRLTMSEGVETIGDRAFYKCYSLGKYPREYTDDLPRKLKLDLPTTLKTIGEAAFYNCGSLGGEITISGGVTSVSDSAFYFCSSLDTLVLEAGVTSIGKAAFYRCGSLRYLTLPDGLLSIGESAFYGGYSLGLIDSTKLTLPESLTSIGANAFNLVRGRIDRFTTVPLEKIHEINKVIVKRTTPASLGADAFSDVDNTALKILVPSGSVATYKAADGWSAYSGKIE